MPIPSVKTSMKLDTLAIWPRGSHFLMALPNRDGSQTMTLYMPETGPVSFQTIDSPEKVKSYFAEFYPDAIPLMPDFAEEYMQNPTGFLGTVFMGPWYHRDKLLLLGNLFFLFDILRKFLQNRMNQFFSPHIFLLISFQAMHRMQSLPSLARDATRGWKTSGS